MALFTLSFPVPADNARKIWDDTTDPRTLVSAVFSMVAPIDSEIFNSGLGGLTGVTEPLAQALAATGFTGYRLVPATTEPTQYPNDYGPDPSTLVFPRLFALQITGQPGIDDFAKTYRPVLSERLTDFLCTRDSALTKSRGEVEVSGRMVRRSVSE
ncbi:hypothetical protein F5X71_12595 [Nocardia brasiliensis]|uniref:Uncharacterized protein n=1 Tax=Nocardia brasiliensis TaxID=37326 RepID=A0A6G9XQB8_NOCBR|nr:hypothetical protein [Nocardia brasiliensis]QIS03040.1 hypothetical protein F5X71_12595 [Nocardia brasiliensis]